MDYAELVKQFQEQTRARFVELEAVQSKLENNLEDQLKSALRSVTVNRYENGSTYISIKVNDISFNIKITAESQLDFATASVNGFCGFMSAGSEPVCPVYQHI